LEETMSDKSNQVQQLANALRQYIRNDVAGPYTALTPQAAPDNTYIITVKDGRNRGMLRITVEEMGASHG
jgi:hypothetical protein